MSMVCLYFPRHVCNCYSKNALWFLLPCQTALWYWLHVKNNLPVLLVQNNLIFQLLLYAFFYWKREAYLSLFWFDCTNTIEWSKSIQILKSVFELYLCHQTWSWSRLSSLWVSNDVLSVICWTYFTSICTTKKPPPLLINTEHCVCNHCHGHEKKQKKKQFPNSNVANGLLSICQYSRWARYV